MQFYRLVIFTGVSLLTLEIMLDYLILMFER